MNWGGWFPHPVEDIDVLNRMPSRKAEYRETYDLIYNNPHAQLFLIYDPATRQPYPGQILYSDINKKLKETYKSLPEAPSGYKYSIPDGISRAAISYCYTREPTEYEAYQIFLAFEEHVTCDRLIEACTYDQQLLSNKPVDGVFAFIWRLALYMNGSATFIPATAFVDLMDGVSRLTHLQVDIARVNTLMKFLKDKAEELVDAIGSNHYAGSFRWAQASGVNR